MGNLSRISERFFICVKNIAPFHGNVASNLINVANNSGYIASYVANVVYKQNIAHMDQNIARKRVDVATN